MVNWISSLLGENMPPAVGVIAMFALAILAIGFLLWIAKRILGGTFVAGGRARHLRLAVMDATPVDSRRRLVLVRRDDVEHLILIGGPTDVVVEQNIRLSQAPAAKQPALAASVESMPTRLDPDAEPRTTKLEGPMKSAEPARQVNPAIGVTERTTMPPRPTPTVPPRPAPLPPRPLEQQRPAAQPIPAAPPRPAPAYVAPSSGPASSVGGSNYQPRPIAIPAQPIAPAVPVPMATSTPEIVAEPLVAKPGSLEPKLAVAAAAIVPLAGNIQTNDVPSTVPDPNDSLLLDLSDEIARVEGSETGSDDISLEEEMESLLADLDVKAERAT